VELIVRRGALRRYDKLKQKTAGLDITLSWDRRLEERRSMAKGAGDHDRRTTGRRQTPPFTWELADFVVKTKGTGRRRK